MSRLAMHLMCAVVLAACGGRGGIGGRDGGIDAAGQPSGAAGGGGGMGGAGPFDLDGGAADGGAVNGDADGPAAPPILPGWTGARRLGDAEYARSVQDLLGFTGHDEELLSVLAVIPDRVVDQFDNLAEGMSVGPARLQAYFANAVNMTALAFADPKARAALVPCVAGAAGDDSCATQVVHAFARRAWRRPLAAAELAELVALVRGGLDAGETFDVAIQRPFAALLVSDSFLYRVELRPTPEETRPNQITAHELATRLSYLLWSTTPDETLLSLADSGALLMPDVLRAQATRLLGDARADGFVRNFLGQWLGFRALQGPALDRIPASFEWSDLTQQSSAEEARLFVSSWLAREEPFTSLLTNDVNFTDLRLGILYGTITNWSSSSDPVFKETRIPGDERKGYLGLIALLAAESTRAESSPTRRGRWVAERLLCMEQPPLPGTHDALGLGFERFDNMGRHRTNYQDGPAITPRGTYPGGGDFVGLEALADLLAADPRVRTCAVHKAYEYALGRRLDDQDTARVAAIEARAGAGASLRGILAALIADEAFQLRRSEGAP